MANLRTSMDASFGDLNLASPQSLVHGSAKFVPGEPFPVDGAKASRALRAQQLSLMGLGFPLGIIPSCSSTSQKELASFNMQSLLIMPSTSNWWLGLIGQFRPQKLISAIKAEVAGGDEFELPAFKDVARHVLDKSLYALGICSQLSLSDSCSLLLSTEAHGEKKGRRTKAMLYHKLPYHDITLEAAFPELFLDHNGKYWDVPESVSLDLSSLVSETGLRYRIGAHKKGGLPQTTNGLDGEAPPGLMPGFCAKGAFSYEKSRDIWRQKEKEEDTRIMTDRGWFPRPSYDSRLKEPHAAVSGIIGGTCALGTKQQLMAIESREIGDNTNTLNKTIGYLNADLFGSVCYTLQHGSFRQQYNDLTRLDTRLDICSASALSKGFLNIFRRSSANETKNPLTSPRLNMIFQQQVAGPIVFRVDSKINLFDSSTEKRGPRVEDLIYSLSYSLTLLRSGKVVAWYSPKRKEGMIELRLYEF